MAHTVSTTLNGAEFSIETGRFAKQADGAVMVRHGDTMVLVTAVAATQDSHLPFLPLTVEYREKLSAAGKIPGGFLKREGRPSDREILSARLIDRPCRPMFPKQWRRETQIIATVLSHDQEHQSDMMAAIGASAALMISSIPFDGPISEVRVSRIDGEFIVNPRHTQIEESDMDLVIAGTDDSVVMVEGFSSEMDEEDFLQALEFGHAQIKQLNDLQRQLQALVPKEKQEVEVVEPPQEIVDFVQAEVQATLHEQVRAVTDKETRNNNRKELTESLQEKAAEKFTEEEYPDVDVAKVVNEAISNIEKHEMREMILSENKRLDGRTSTDIRPITIQTGVLPRAHGSALFTRGETQSLGIVTLGTKLDEQMVDGIMPTYTNTFMLHYTFPPYSTNEVKRIMGVSRREVGHGNLAERSLKSQLPSSDEFPYTIRVMSEILESNGSSSMASVCSGSLAMFQAGVPFKKAVSGIAMGLVKEGDRVAILSDILGDEDFLGDMDFKVAGTADGITACQMDMKIQGISMEVLRTALLQAKDGRMHILNLMNEAMDKPNEELSPYAPRFTVIQIPTDMIGAIIGPGGETIRSITKETGTDINIEDDGKVTISATSGEAAAKAKEIIDQITRQPEEGEVYTGKVTDVREGLGAIVEFLPKKQGLLHISQIDFKRVENVGEYFSVGDEVEVKLIEVQRDGKFRLSRKALMTPPEGYVEPPSRPRGDRDRRGGDRDRRGGRRDDRRRDDRR
jgi:polyribonucleotide nucleotidyltransferase